MLSDPSYYNSEWYNKETDSLKSDAPEAYRNEYRFYHAKHYYRNRMSRKEIVAEYADEDGVMYVIDFNGVILREGSVDKKRYVEIDF